MTPSYALGIFFLVVVSILWTLCSIVVQHLYRDLHFDSPFLIVYIGTSLFSVFLPSRLVYERRRRCRNALGRCWGRVFERSRSGNLSDGWEDASDGEKVVVIPWKNVSCEDDGDSDIPLQVSTEIADVHDNETGQIEEYQAQEATHDASLSRNRQTQKIQSDTRMYQGRRECFIFSHMDHIAMASKIAPLWFMSNYFYAISLKLTSIVSSTVLASTGAIFAFLFATFSKFGDETFTALKFAGVIVCFVGGAATAWGDFQSNDSNGGGGGTDRHLILGDELGDGFSRILRQPGMYWHILDNGVLRSLEGDLAGLVSAIGYGAYTVMIRRLCPKDESRMSMQLLFGYIGALNMLLLLPVAIWMIATTGNEDTTAFDSDDSTKSPVTSHRLTWSILSFLVGKGMLDNVLSDYLWARAVVLTSATTASVGVGLTIPMAFVGDWAMGNPGAVNIVSVCGALSVLVGFLLVNVGGGDDCIDSPEQAMM